MTTPPADNAGPHLESQPDPTSGNASEWNPHATDGSPPPSPTDPVKQFSGHKFALKTMLGDCSGLVDELEASGRLTPHNIQSVMSGVSMLKAQARETLRNGLYRLTFDEVRDSLSVSSSRIETIIDMPATDKMFVVKEHFVQDAVGVSGIKFIHLDQLFVERFLTGEGKVESPTPTHKLARVTIVHGTKDSRIIDELGGPDLVETMVADVCHLIVEAMTDKNLQLDMDGWENIFYIRDLIGELQVVHVWEDDAGWVVNTRAIDSQPNGQDGKCRVFVRTLVP